MRIRRIEPVDGALLRRTRLRAIADQPGDTTATLGQTEALERRALGARRRGERVRGHAGHVLRGRRRRRRCGRGGHGRRVRDGRPRRHDGRSLVCARLPGHRGGRRTPGGGRGLGHEQRRRPAAHVGGGAQRALPTLLRAARVQGQRADDALRAGPTRDRGRDAPGARPVDRTRSAPERPAPAGAPAGDARWGRRAAFDGAGFRGGRSGR